MGAEAGWFYRGVSEGSKDYCYRDGRTSHLQAQ